MERVHFLGDGPVLGLQYTTLQFNLDSAIYYVWGLNLCLPQLCHLKMSEPPGESQKYGVGSHSLLQGIFLTQGSNLGLPHYRQILYHLGHEGSPTNGTDLIELL